MVLDPKAAAVFQIGFLLRRRNGMENLFCTDGRRYGWDPAPDLTVSIRAFGQMAAGSVSLDEAVYRPDVTVHGNGDVLTKVFIRKPILVEDHF